VPELALEDDGTVSSYDRDQVLFHTDLTALASEICGPPRGSGPGAKWHCPSPEHPDEHPSMTVFTGSRSQRWKCHSCGEGGTAIDLWMLVKGSGVGEAIEALGSRTPLVRGRSDTFRDPQPTRGHGHGKSEPASRVSPLPRAAEAPASQPVDPDIEAYVATAEEILWTPRGEVGREWLHNRGLSDDVVRANRVGFDPGPRAFRRRRELPRRGAGVVYPVLGSDEKAVYFQTRYLDPVAAGRGKYDNPWGGIAANPRVVPIRVPSPDPHLSDLVVVTEGIPDGLVVAETGAPVAAVIGAANYGTEVVQRLHSAFPRGRFAVLWDADHGGRRGGCILGVRLRAIGRDVVLGAPPFGFGDVSEWWQADLAGLPSAIASTAHPVLYVPNGHSLPATRLAPTASVGTGIE
jgi:hypothetical protein